MKISLHRPTENKIPAETFSDLLQYFQIIYRSTPVVAEAILRNTLVVAQGHQFGIIGALGVVIDELSHAVFHAEDYGSLQQVQLGSTDDNFQKTRQNVFQEFSALAKTNPDLINNLEWRAILVGNAIDDEITRYVSQIFGGCAHRNYTDDAQILANPKGIQQHIHQIVTRLTQHALVGFGRNGKVDPAHRCRSLYEALALPGYDVAKHDYPILITAGVNTKSANSFGDENELIQQCVQNAISGLAQTLSLDCEQHLFQDSVSIQKDLFSLKQFNVFRRYIGWPNDTLKNVLNQHEFKTVMYFKGLARDIAYHNSQQGEFLLTEGEIKLLFSVITERDDKLSQILFNNCQPTRISQFTETNSERFYAITYTNIKELIQSSSTKEEQITNILDSLDRFFGVPAPRKVDARHAQFQHKKQGEDIENIPHRILFYGLMRKRSEIAANRASNNTLMLDDATGLKTPQNILEVQTIDGKVNFIERAYYRISYGNNPNMKSLLIPSSLMLALSVGCINVTEVREIMDSNIANEKLSHIVFSKLTTFLDQLIENSHDALPPDSNGYAQLKEELFNQLFQNIIALRSCNNLGAEPDGMVCAQSVHLSYQNISDQQNSNVLDVQSVRKPDPRSQRHIEMKFFIDGNFTDGFRSCGQQILSIESHLENDANTSSISLRKVLDGFYPEGFENAVQPPDAHLSPRMVIGDGYVAHTFSLKPPQYNIDGFNEGMTESIKKPIPLFLCRARDGKPRVLLERQFRPLLALSFMLDKGIIQTAQVTQAVMTSAVGMSMTNLADDTPLSAKTLSEKLHLSHNAISELLEKCNGQVNLAEMLKFISNGKASLETTREIVDVFLSILDSNILITRLGESFIQYSASLGHQAHHLLPDSIDKANRLAGHVPYDGDVSLSESNIQKYLGTNCDARLLCSTTRRSKAGDIAAGFAIDPYSSNVTIRINIPEGERSDSYVSQLKDLERQFYERENDLVAQWLEMSWNDPLPPQK